ncbi:MAG: Rpn family recombination-promoting nuclease/putative transposase [bacterium]|nr:Rpn family recombination-promoting nuclease/putative transposase [bacterium]
MEQITNPHDKFFKEVFTRKNTAKEFLLNYLPANVVSLLDLDSLERGFRHPFGKNLDFLSADKHYFSGFWGNLQEFQKLAFQGQNRVFGLFWATVDDWPECRNLL